jgi:hypothetical protein
MEAVTNEQIAGAIVMAVLRAGDRIETAIYNSQPGGYAENRSDGSIRDEAEEILQANGRAPYP